MPFDRLFLKRYHNFLLMKNANSNDVYFEGRDMAWLKVPDLVPLLPRQRKRAGSRLGHV